MAEQITHLQVSGMTCSNCARHVAEALREVDGVSGAQVDLEKHAATVRWKANQAENVPVLLQALQAAGYGGELRADAASRPAPRRWAPGGWELNILLGLTATVPMIVAEWLLGLGTSRTYHWFAFFLALPVQTLGGWRFYRGAWAQLKIGGSNMDTLVALGSTTAFAFSVWGLLSGWHGHLYFMDAAAIITLISLGHFLELKASAQAANSLRALLRLAPETAWRLDAAGREVEIPIASLAAGDTILIRPGDRVPTDADILEGASAVDESMLTGESLPVEKAKDARVYAGTVNQNGRLIARVAATGEATALARIIQIVEQAQSSRANIQKLGDKVSSYFVPIVVLIAAATGLWWGLAPESAARASLWISPWLWTPHGGAEGPLSSAIFHAAAVLIVACPCAMGLATPIAIMAGTNAAAKRGILIRDGMALEKTGLLTAILFDKTGTLTQGKVEVAATAEFGDSGLEAVAAAASLAHSSRHPLSRAISKLAPPTIPLENWREIWGSGLSAQTPDGKPLLLGSLNWMGESGVSVEAGKAFIAEWSKTGATLLALAADGRLAALFALSDPLKEKAPAVIRHLRAQGKTVCLVTGDHAATALAIAAQAGIDPDQVFASVRPEQKAEIVKRLQKQGQKVAFIGDGINDAPALEQADLGIALSSASDAAREAADIILLKSDIEAIPEALGLAAATLRTIKQNLFWAFFYNAAGIPLAMLGFFSPVVSALAMGLSDLIVIGNALRLRFWKKPL